MRTPSRESGSQKKIMKSTQATRSSLRLRGSNLPFDAQETATIVLLESPNNTGDEETDSNQTKEQTNPSSVEPEVSSKGKGVATSSTPVNSAIREIPIFSTHFDDDDIDKWLSGGISLRPTVQHTPPSAPIELAQYLQELKMWIEIPMGELLVEPFSQMQLLNILEKIKPWVSILSVPQKKCLDLANLFCKELEGKYAFIQQVHLEDSTLGIEKQLLLKDRERLRQSRSASHLSILDFDEKLSKISIEMAELERRLQALREEKEEFERLKSSVQTKDNEDLLALNQARDLAHGLIQKEIELAGKQEQIVEIKKQLSDLHTSLYQAAASM